MTHEEYGAFLADISMVTARTRAIVFADTDEEGAVQLMLFPRRRLPLERIVAPTRRRRRRPSV